MQEMTGLGLQHDAMAGMDDQDPSPHEGMSVAEAKENFKTQSAELKAITFGAFAYIGGKNASLLRSQGDRKEIVEEFYDRAMKSGERSASTWLISEMEARGTAP